MKKAVIIFSLLSLVALLIGVINTFSDLAFWSFSSTFLHQIELFTFLLNHVFMIICIVLSIKMLSQTKNLLYLVSLFFPILSVGIGWYFFFVRIINEIFF